MKKETDIVESSLKNINRHLENLKTEIVQLRSELAKKDDKIKRLTEKAEKFLSWGTEAKQQVVELDDKLSKIISGNIDNVICGLEFEKHVVWWMSNYYPIYELQIWQGDKAQCWNDRFNGEQQINAAWNKYPDLIFANTQEKKLLALECKYRKDGTFILSRRKYEDYLHFQKGISKFVNIEISTYIMIGTGGEDSSRPKYMYCVPLDTFDFSNDKKEVKMEMEQNYQYRIMYRNTKNQLTNYSKCIPF